MKLFEIFNSRSNVSWIHDGNTSYGIFFVDEKKYAVSIEMLQMRNFVLPDDAPTVLKRMKLSSVMFGNVDDNGVLNTKTALAPKSSSTLRILSSVRHATNTWVKNNDPDVVVFATKREDTKELSKANIYSLMATRAAKENGFVIKKLDSDKGQYFLLIANDFYKMMTPKDFKILEKEALGIESKTLNRLKK